MNIHYLELHTILNKLQEAPECFHPRFEFLNQIKKLHGNLIFINNRLIIVINKTAK